MPQVTVAIAANGDDGSVSRYDTVYPPVTNPQTSLGTNYAFSEKSLLTGTYYVSCGLVRFNTGAVLPDSATVTAATLRFYNEFDTTADARNLSIEWYAGASWASSGGASDADYTTAVGTTAASVALGATMPTGTVDVVLASVVNVSLTGYTGLRMGVSGAAPTAVNELYYVALEHASLAESSLIIDYTDATAPTLFRPGGSGLRW